jgi:hypothetical protein
MAIKTLSLVSMTDKEAIKDQLRSYITEIYEDHGLVVMGGI